MLQAFMLKFLLFIFYFFQLKFLLFVQSYILASPFTNIVMLNKLLMPFIL